MKLENQVCSFKLAKELEKLGVKQESLWYYSRHKEKKYNILREGVIVPCKEANDKRHNEHIFISAFTVAELGEIIGPGLNIRINISSNIVVFHTLFEGGFTSETEADARAKMLIYLLNKK